MLLQPLEPGVIVIAMTGDICWTLFMSPERARGKKLGGRFDIYSLELVLFFMLCGKLPGRVGSEEEK